MLFMRLLLEIQRNFLPPWFFVTVFFRVVTTTLPHLRWEKRTKSESWSNRRYWLNVFEYFVYFTSSTCIWQFFRNFDDCFNMMSLGEQVQCGD